MTQPLVSIGIPTYNSNGMVMKALMSVLNQGYPSIEVVISDNCSTDNTQTICTQLSKTYPCIRYIRQARNIGLVPNFEYVLKHARGDFFMWVADDDSLEPGILEKYIRFMTAHPRYALVSGRIQYWEDDALKFCEQDFNIEYDSRNIRVLSFYSKVKYGAIYHGLMRKEFAMQIPLRNGIGTDWHFVAGLAFLGKIRNLDSVGYNKRLDGSSKSFKHYAKVIGASWFSANFPHLKMALDAFWEILHRSKIYREAPLYSNLLLAVSSCGGVLFNYYCREFPFVVGGKLKRLIGLGKTKMRSARQSPQMNKVGA